MEWFLMCSFQVHVFKTYYIACQKDKKKEILIKKRIYFMFLNIYIYK